MEGAVFGLGYFAKMPGGRTVQVRRNEPHPPGKEELTAEHIADAAEILPVLDDEPSLALALSRLTQASMRSSAADRMLDLMIVVEALLTTKDENGEINYRLALRGARLLAELADRAAVRKTIKRCYNARSKVVH